MAGAAEAKDLVAALVRRQALVVVLVVRLGGGSGRSFFRLSVAGRRVGRQGDACDRQQDGKRHGQDRPGRGGEGRGPCRQWHGGQLTRTEIRCIELLR